MNERKKIVLRFCMSCVISVYKKIYLFPLLMKTICKRYYDCFTKKLKFQREHNNSIFPHKMSIGYLKINKKK